MSKPKKGNKDGAAQAAPESPDAEAMRASAVMVMPLKKRKELPPVVVAGLILFLIAALVLAILYGKPNPHGSFALVPY